MLLPQSVCFTQQVSCIFFLRGCTSLWHWVKRFDGYLLLRGLLIYHCRLVRRSKVWSNTDSCFKVVHVCISTPKGTQLAYWRSLWMKHTSNDLRLLWREDSVAWASDLVAKLVRHAQRCVCFTSKGEILVRGRLHLTIYENKDKF